MTTTPAKEWRFELTPVGASLLIDFYTQSELASKNVDAKFSILASNEWKEITIWGVRRFAYIRKGDELRPEFREVNPSRPPSFVQERRSESERLLCHVEINHGTPAAPGLKFHAESPNLEIKLEVDPIQLYVEVWRAEHLKVYDGTRLIEFFSRLLKERTSDFRPDEAVLRDQTRLLKVPHTS